VPRHGVRGSSCRCGPLLAARRAVDPTGGEDVAPVAGVDKEWEGRTGHDRWWVGEDGGAVASPDPAPVVSSVGFKRESEGGRQLRWVAGGGGRRSDGRRTVEGEELEG
jgi:hypothetical protein